MNGCVNCVYDTYQQELEEWAAARAKLKRDMSSATKGAGGDAGIGMAGEGGGPDSGDTDVLGGIPVGIREFMALEKKLREKKKAEKG